MTNLLLILLIFVGSYNVKYVADPLWHMALSADKIVYGEITELRENDYTLKIESSLTGDSGTINIQRFQNWTCASRWAPYKKGQKVAVFTENRNGTNHIISGGGEGEMEVKNDSVSIDPVTLKCDVKKLKSDKQIKGFLFVISEIRRAYSIDKKTNKITLKPSTAGNYIYSGLSLFSCLTEEINAVIESKK